MSLIWFALVFGSGAVLGAKHQQIVLFLYEKYKKIISNRKQ